MVYRWLNFATTRDYTKDQKPESEDRSWRAPKGLAIKEKKQKKNNIFGGIFNHVAYSHTAQKVYSYNNVGSGSYRAKVLRLSCYSEKVAYLLSNLWLQNLRQYSFFTA